MVKYSESCAWNRWNRVWLVILVHSAGMVGFRLRPGQGAQVGSKRLSRWQSSVHTIIGPSSSTIKYWILPSEVSCHMLKMTLNDEVTKHLWSAIKAEDMGSCFGDFCLCGRSSGYLRLLSSHKNHKNQESLIFGCCHWICGHGYG